eukprot:SAG31_NODE_5634_length_2412_cov_1.487678_1_plen_439_part_00
MRVLCGSKGFVLSVIVSSAADVLSDEQTCADVPEWTDVDGDGCAVYVANGWCCEPISPGCNAEFADEAGLDSDHACCASCEMEPTCESQIWHMTRCDTTGTGSVYTEHSDPQCSQRIGSQTESEANVWLLTARGGQAMDHCFPGDSGESYSVSCSNDSGENVPTHGTVKIWASSNCGTDDAVVDELLLSGCTCAQNIAEVELPLQECESGIYTRTTCNGEGRGSTRRIFADSSCTSMIGSPTYSSTDWINTVGEQSALGSCNSFDPAAGNEMRSFINSCDETSGVLHLFETSNCTGPVMYVARDDMCECVPATQHDMCQQLHGSDVSCVTTSVILDAGNASCECVRAPAAVSTTTSPRARADDEDHYRTSRSFGTVLAFLVVVAVMALVAAAVRQRRTSKGVVEHRCSTTPSIQPKSQLIQEDNTLADISIGNPIGDA